MPTLDSNLFLIAFLLYLSAAVMYLAVFWFHSARARRAGLNLFAAALAAHTAALAARSLYGGRLPFASMYEFILVFSWGLGALFLAGCRKKEIQTLGFLILPMEVMLLGYALTVRSSVTPLVPALQSVWLQFHVATAVAAYGLFGLSFAASALFLWQEGKNHYFIANQTLDRLIYQLIGAGFPFMTLVLVTGAVWAEETWGVWWNWDPKETWALITWLIYAIYLHLRRTRQWRGRLAAWASLSGFAAVLFTLFGVTLLMPGAHSY